MWAACSASPRRHQARVESPAHSILAQSTAWLVFMQLTQLTKGLLRLRNAEVASAPFSLSSLLSLPFSFFSPLLLLVFLGEMMAA